jgi:hypothetical protein
VYAITLLELFVRESLGFWRGCGFSQLVLWPVKSAYCNVRLFLFHTALASGAAPAFPPFPVEDDRGAESRRPLPVFATKRGLGAARVEDVCAGVLGAGLSPGFGAVEVAPFAARKVLFTETGLKEVNFLIVDAVRA